MTNTIFQKYKNVLKSTKPSQEFSTFLACIYVVNIFNALINEKYVQFFRRSSKFGNLQQNANASHLEKNMFFEFIRKPFAQSWPRSIYCKL